MLNNDVVNILTGNNSLLDAELENLNLYKEKDSKASISMIFSSFRKSSSFRRIKLIFEEVQEFSFYHRSDYYFYTVSNLKFFKLPNGNFFLSLDPDESVLNYSVKDKDFVICESIRLIDLPNDN